MSRYTRVVRAYYDFHGAKPVRERLISFSLPKRFWKMGLASGIRYLPERPSRHYGIEFEHSFGDEGYGVKKGARLPILAASEDGNVIILIKDRSKFKVTRRGIVG